MGFVELNSSFVHSFSENWETLFNQTTRNLRQKIDNDGSLEMTIGETTNKLRMAELSAIATHIFTQLKNDPKSDSWDYSKQEKMNQLASYLDTIASYQESRLPFFRASFQSFSQAFGNRASYGIFLSDSAILKETARTIREESRLTTTQNAHILDDKLEITSQLAEISILSRQRSINPLEKESLQVEDLPITGGVPQTQEWISCYPLSGTTLVELASSQNILDQSIKTLVPSYEKHLIKESTHYWRSGVITIANSQKLHILDLCQLVARCSHLQTLETAQTIHDLAIMYENKTGLYSREFTLFKQVVESFHNYYHFRIFKSNESIMKGVATWIEVKEKPPSLDRDLKENDSWSVMSYFKDLKTRYAQSLENYKKFGSFVSDDTLLKEVPQWFSQISSTKNNSLYC